MSVLDMLLPAVNIQDLTKQLQQFVGAAVKISKQIEGINSKLAAIETDINLIEDRQTEILTKLCEEKNNDD